MKQLGEIFIDSLEFARGERVMRGNVPVRSLLRLTDKLAGDRGELAWSVRGECGAERKSFLVVAVNGELQLKCQRCLGPFQFQLQVEGRLLLVPPGTDWPDEGLENDGFDPVEALTEQSLLELVEDEVLLALPIASRHESCELPGNIEGKHAVSPFAVLARLKKDA